MNGLSLSLIENNAAKKESPCFNWQDSLPIQHLLDAISSILAEEYIAIAKQNPVVFTVCTPLPNPHRKGGGNKINGGKK